VTSRVSQRLVAFALTAIVLFGLLLRLRWFGDALYGDELGAFNDVSGHGLGRLIYVVNGHSNELSPPLYFILAWFSEKLFGTSVQSLRLVAMVSGVATIPLVYVLGRLTVSARAGLVAAVIAALSPLLIFYSAQARPYSLLLVLCLLSTLALLKAIRTGGRVWWIVYAAASCAAMYAHYTAVFVLIVQFGWAALAHPQIRRALFAANLAAAVCFAPWIPSLLREAHSPGLRDYQILEPFTLGAIRSDLGHLWIGSPYQSTAVIPGRAALGLALVGVLVGAVAALVARPRRSSLRMPSPSVMLIALLALGVPLLAALYSTVRTTVWNSEDLITSWPAFAVLLGAVLTSAPGALRAAAIAAVVCAFAIGSFKMLETRYHRPNYTAAVNYIVKADPNRAAPVVDVPDFTPGPLNELEVAFDLRAPAQRHPVLRLGFAPLAAQLRAPPFAPLPAQPGAEVAAQAARLAGFGELFLVVPNPVPNLDTLRASRTPSSSAPPVVRLLVDFLRALPARFRLVAFHSYNGMNRVAVYTFQG
jgi:4-amino-4-deoxy-L-arabinose transferase-like glycosyltransferase